MWAYGALLRCLEDESMRFYSTFDCGVSTSVSKRTVDNIEVGILKKFIASLSLDRASLSWKQYGLNWKWCRRMGWDFRRQGWPKTNESIHITCQHQTSVLHRRRVNIGVEHYHATWTKVALYCWKLIRCLRLQSRQQNFEQIERPTSNSIGLDPITHENVLVREVPIVRVAELDANLTRAKDDLHHDNNEYKDNNESNIRAT